MKRNLLHLAILSLLFACSAPDQQAKLSELKKQRDALNEEIALLEKTTDVTIDSVKTNIKEVAITDIAPQSFQHYIEIQGKVDGEQNITLSAEMLGAVKKINVREGDEVKAGQILAELDNQMVVQTIAEVQNQLEFASNIYLKQKNLWEQKIGTEIQFLSAKNNKESLEKKLATLNEQLNLSKIKSPINGTVDEVMLKLGQNAAPGIPAIRVVNLDNLKIKAEVADTYIGKIKKGNFVTVNFPDLQTEVQSTISHSGKVINPLTRSFIVEVPLKGENNQDLKPNMVAILKIADYTKENSIVVPVNAVQNSDEGDYVYVAETKQGRTVAVKKNITTGLTYNNNVEVKNGLNAGDKIITKGFQELNPDEQVRYN